MNSVRDLGVGALVAGVIETGNPTDEQLDSVITPVEPRVVEHKPVKPEKSEAIKSVLRDSLKILHPENLILMVLDRRCSCRQITNNPDSDRKCLVLSDVEFIDGSVGAVAATRWADYCEAFRSVLMPSTFEQLNKVPEIGYVRYFSQREGNEPVVATMRIEGLR